MGEREREQRKENRIYKVNQEIKKSLNHLKFDKKQIELELKKKRHRNRKREVKGIENKDEERA